ncbi:hypothetical protein [Amycolatopsis regifaucium]|uniref:DUF600 domain-containing protein n=1 Tax=Amycolatopsis regifaucium TaxID=546365 RepID=A0A154MTI6_9PSEU|nr:hypothetical protein [Amycolatopsis regifaucium]KZB87585.1 hypothetical protein AVL48_23525 [Amycolatopsis regifaucium]OKA08414.1 hypothetical protein ATP06_0214285 [Amycolatopsis regifaucium]
MTSGGETHEDLIQQLGTALLDLVPVEGWRRIDLVSAMTVPAQDLGLTVIMDDGSRPEIAPPTELNVILAKLRTLLYRPGRGAWFSARISMNPPGAIFYDYNYDYEPVLTPPMEPEHYVEDLKKFPRDPEHIPAWLSEKLAAANDKERD